jgi:hypothetical protein
VNRRHLVLSATIATTLAAGLDSGAGTAWADNTKFPEQRELVEITLDAGAGNAPDSLGGGKGGSEPPPVAALTGPATSPTVDLEAGTVTPAPGSLPARIQEAPLEVAQEVVQGVRSGQGYRFAAAAVLAALMVLGLKFAPRLFGKTDRGKAIAVMVLATLATVSTAIAGNVPLSSPGLWTAAIGLAFTAVGGRQWISRLLWPADGGSPWFEWLKPVLGAGAKRDEGPPF